MQPHNDHDNQQLSTVNDEAGKTLSVHLLQAVPEEEIWLAGQLSPHTRRAYKRDVAHFVRAMGIRSADELRQVGAQQSSPGRT